MFVLYIHFYTWLILFRVVGGMKPSLDVVGLEALLSIPVLTPQLQLQQLTMFFPKGCKKSKASPNRAT